MKTKISNNPKPKSTIPDCPYEIPISTIYNPTSNQTTVPMVSIYNPNSNQNTRPPENGKKSQFINKFCVEKLKAQFHKDHRKKVEFYLTLCFLITLVATGALIVIMHKSTTKDLLLVHGEFSILNVDFSTNLTHRNSSQFNHISKEIIRSMDRTFLIPGLGDFYQSCKITSISPEFNVHVLLTFANDPSVTIGQIGLTFIRGLRILHGKTWLGNFIVNVQSIGFMISGEEGVWGNWSEWSKCNSMRVSTRTRPCLTKTGTKLSSVDRCLLIPGTKSDLDIRKCSLDEMAHDQSEQAPPISALPESEGEANIESKDKSHFEQKFRSETNEEISRSVENVSDRINIETDSENEYSSSEASISTETLPNLDKIEEQKVTRNRVRKERTN